MLILICMVAARSIADHAPRPSDVDQRLVLYGVPWRDYLLLGDLFIDRPGLHLTYVEGTLEIMTTSPRHERIKTLIARLVELHALIFEVRITGFGSATYRREGTRSRTGRVLLHRRREAVRTYYQELTAAKR